jgi:hypothetical protein
MMVPKIIYFMLKNDDFIGHERSELYEVKLSHFVIWKLCTLRY